MPRITTRVQLGQTNLKVSPIGFGVLTMGYAQLNLPIDEGAGLIRYAYECGINFFDTAQYYRTYPYIKKALEGMDEKPIISTKTLNPSYDGALNAVYEAIESMGLDSIDIFLLHEIRGAADWEYRKDAFKALLDCKAKSLIKYVGVSTHHIDTVEQMATIPECDVVFPLINYAGLGIRKGDGPGSVQDMENAIRHCHDAGKGVYSMKAFGGGNLTGEYVKALTYATSLYGVDSVMIGIGQKKEVDVLTSFVNGTLPKDYRPDISHKKIRIDAGDCMGCGECINRCPNGALSWGKGGFAKVDHEICLTCGYCAPVCPSRAIIMW